MRAFVTISFLFVFVTGFCQSDYLSYYLPDISYDRSVPAPHEFLNYDVGDWHVSHDQTRILYGRAGQNV